MISDLRPGTRVDVLDQYSVWSGARVQSVVKVHQTNNKPKEVVVTIRCDGWGPEWDEDIPLPTHRLAPLYTFTKQVKCLVAGLLPKKPTSRSNKKKWHNGLWPARVQFRMPHPVKEPPPRQKGSHHTQTTDDDDTNECLDAELMLSQEPRVYVRPYAPECLPRYVVLDPDGGVWLKASICLRLWRDEPNELGVLHPDLVKAWQCALVDKKVRGKLRTHMKPLPDGSLLADQFRVFSRQGATKKDGCLVEGAGTPEWIVRARRERDTHKNGQSAVIDFSREDASEAMDYAAGQDDVRSLERRPSLERAVEQGRYSSEDSTEVDPKPVTFVEPDSKLVGIVEDGAHELDAVGRATPPQLPPPVIMTEPLYPGVKYSDTSNRFLSMINMGGNDIVLGAFPTQTQAYQATQLAMGSSLDDNNNNNDNNQMMDDTEQAVLADLNAVPLEAMMRAVETQWEPARNFSMHQWTLDVAAHHVYCRDKECETEDEMDSDAPARVERASKRKGHPRKVDLLQRRYISSIQ